MAHQNPPDEPVIAGPFSLANDSFIVEFLQPDPSRNATVLMRMRWVYTSPLCKQQVHPLSPPLHLHFDQSESFQVISGAVGTTTTYDVVDHVWTPDDGVQELKTWIPHKFWHVPNDTEDTVILLWAHPELVPEPMDRHFFQNLLMYLSDIYEKKATMDPFQFMLLQHVTGSALVMLPTWKFLGPLRWWLPWKLQAAFSYVARLMGKAPLMEKYTDKEAWNELQRLKKK